MKQYLLLGTLALTLAACGQKPDAAQAGNDGAAGATGSAPVAAVSPPRANEPKGVDALTALGFKPDFAYSVAYDLVDKGGQGVNRHRVLLEVLDSDMTTAMASATKTLAEAGYVKSRDAEANGRQDAVFTKHGSPTLVFMAQSAERGPELKSADAVGSIHIMWNFY